MLRPFGVKPVFEHQSADGAPALFHYLQAHMGVTVLSEGAAHLLPSRLTMRPFNPPPVPVGVGLSQISRNEQAEAFVKILHEVVAGSRRPRTR